ncbi:hypothetical protein B0H13DRAFT_2655501 [Mycena leptocephala]|nr:hypothetical protein B0H13DRAFT_2655501 [Mycena leptocephala]
MAYLHDSARRHPRPATHRNFLLSLCPCLHIHVLPRPPPRFAPPRPRALITARAVAPLSTPSPIPCSPAHPTRASQHPPAAGCAALTQHTRMVDARTPKSSAPHDACSPPIPTTPRPDRHRHQPTAPPPRRALAAPRDEPALRVGALTGPRPPVACLSLSVRLSVRRGLARGASNPAGHARHPPPLPAWFCAPAVVGGWSSRRSPLLYSMSTPAPPLPSSA